MRINTKTGDIELLQAERDSLTKAARVAVLIRKHADDGSRLQGRALRAIESIDQLQDALANQSTPDGQLVAQATEAPPY